mgnify:CR=1 FL=1
MKLPRRKFLHPAAAVAGLPAVAGQFFNKAAAQSVSAGMREVPARTLPVASL